MSIILYPDLVLLPLAMKPPHPLVKSGGLDDCKRKLDRDTCILMLSLSYVEFVFVKS